MQVIGRRAREHSKGAEAGGEPGKVIRSDPGGGNSAIFKKLLNIFVDLMRFPCATVAELWQRAAAAGRGAMRSGGLRRAAVRRGGPRHRGRGQGEDEHPRGRGSGKSAGPSQNGV